jgi:hypothetical protein
MSSARYLRAVGRSIGTVRERSSPVDGGDDDD